MTAVLRREETNQKKKKERKKPHGDTVEKVLRRHRQRLELRCHKPRDAWSNQKLEEAKKDFPL